MRLASAEPLRVGMGGEGVDVASHAQSEYWLLHQMEPGLTADRMPLAWRLLGGLNGEVLYGVFVG